MPKAVDTEVGFDSEEVREEEKAPILYIEVFDRRDSGFYMDTDGTPAGTRGTKFEIGIDCPTASFIPNRGFRKGYKDVIDRITGKPVIDKKTGEKKVQSYHEAIRYIKHETEISVEKQKMLGIVPHRAGQEDMIEIKKGNMTIIREGSFISLYDYILEAFYNGSNPDRSPGAAKLYRVIELGKEEEEMNDDDIMMADALMFIARFYQRTGKGKYKYNEEKINGLCELFTIFGETMSGKVSALNSLAKTDPEGFLKKATKFEQVTITEITHALQLNVIRFKENVVEYVKKEKVLGSLGTGKMTHENKIEKLADLLHAPEMKAEYEEFQLELEVAQEEALKS
jgi:hypothetical protein